MATQKTYSAQEARQRFDSLPPAIQDLIYSEQSSRTVETLGAKYKLHLDQMSVLETQIAAVMMGFTEPQDFPMMLEERLHVDAGLATSIAKDLDVELFQKMRESLKKITAPEPVATEPSKPPAVQSPPVPQSATPLPAVPSSHEITPMHPELTAPKVAMPQPAATPSVPPAAGVAAPAPVPMPAPPPKTPEHPADVVLSQPTSSLAKTIDVGGLPENKKTAPVAPQNPNQYKADPYREPIE